MNEETDITLQIKNMVCDRCISRVTEILRDSDFTVAEISLGKAEISGIPGDWSGLKSQLQKEGFELVEDPAHQRIEEIKSVLVTHLYALAQQKEAPKQLSRLLTRHIPWHYEGLSRTFKKHTDMTVERYFILLKMEKVKELLEYGDLTVQQIADRLGYSSGQHLSSQFKKETGVSVSQYRQTGRPPRKRLDEVG